MSETGKALIYAVSLNVMAFFRPPEARQVETADVTTGRYAIHEYKDNRIIGEIVRPLAAGSRDIYR